MTSTPVYVMGGFYGGQGSADGQFLAPGGIAVEPGTRNVLVADTGNTRIQVLAPSGNGVQFLTSFGTGALTAPFGLAIDQTSGAVYVTGTVTGNPVIRRYTSDGAATPTYTLDGGFTSPSIASARSALAVDPTTHELLVADTGTQEVKRFDVGDGHLISSFNGSTSGGGAFTSLRSVAVAPSGTVYVADEPYQDAVFVQEGSGRVERFDAAGAPQGPLQGMDQASAVAVDGVTGQAVASWLNVFYTAPRLLSLFDAGSDAASSTLGIPSELGGTVGLAYDGTGVHDIFALLDQELVGPTGTPGVQRVRATARPGAEIGSTSAVGETTAHVTGAVAPGIASGDATVHFEYSFAGGIEQVTPDQTVVAGSGETTVSEDLTGLRPNTTYTVRLVASNSDYSGDAKTVSSTTTFTTGVVVPGVRISSVTDRTAVSAVLNARVNPYGQQTRYHFEYGQSDAYGSVLPVGEEDVAGSSYAFRVVSHSVSGLKPQTTYHYRLVAHNATGSSVTQDATFTTRPAAEPARAYEQVTPIDKGGAVLNTYGFYHARADGNALAYQTKNAMNLPGVEGAPNESRYASRRTSTGWDLRSLDASQNPVPVPELLSLSTMAVSSDFSHALVASNRKLAPGGVEGSGNLYRRDVETGAYELVATGLSFGFISGPSGTDIFFGGSADFSTISIASDAKLTADASAIGFINMYQWTASQGLKLVSRLPDGSPSNGGVTYFNRLSWPARDYATADGSQVYFAMVASSADGIYRTENGVTERILDPGEPVRVADVTPDGRYVVYIGTANSDIYRYDTRNGTSEFVFSDGGFLGISDDGSTIVAAGDARGAPRAWHDGVTTTIGLANGYEGVATWGVAISPNGRYFVFDTTSLQGQDYDNTGCAENPVDGSHDGRCYEVYVYDVVLKELTCASCPVDGSGSTGHAHLGPGAIELSLHGGRFVNDDGEAFFTTATQLVAADANDTNDVYMYQDGEVQLISPGKGKHNATLADVSEDGSDVFFITDERLVGQDRDDHLDMYDARVGGGIPAQSKDGDEVAPCGGPECREVTAGPTTSPTVASQTASGLPETPVPGAKAKVSVLKVTTTSSLLRVKLRVSGRGVVRVSSAAVTRKSVSVSRAGTYTVEAKWTKRTRSSRRAKRRVKVAARVSLTPPFGATAVVRFKRTLGK